MDRGAWRGYSPRGRRESDKTEATQHPAKPGPGAKGPRCSCGWRLSPERSLPTADLGASCLERVRTDGGLHLPIPVFGGQTLRDSDASLRGKDQGVSDSVRLLGLRSARLLCPWDSPGKDYRSGLPLPAPGDLPNPGVESTSAAAAGGFFTAKASREIPGASALRP